MFKLLIKYVSTFKGHRVGGYLNSDFSDADMVIIRHYQEKGYTADKIWEDNLEKHWDKTLVKQLLKRFEAFGTMERPTSSSCLQTATTPENKEAVEEMICS